MKPTVYIETSVVSSLTARPSQDVVVAAYQEITREWGRGAAESFNLLASELLLAEAVADATRKRSAGYTNHGLVDNSQLAFIPTHMLTSAYLSS